ncbi:MAG: tetratricopeptide repeat protein [Chromatiales bacterium]|jgi:TolB-like protein/Tfp pilus assembly protein PilF
MASFLTELKRRNVFRVGALYLVAGWLILQVADVLAGLLGLPDWTLRFVAFLLMLGFPLALVFSWVYELTPEGIKRESEIDRTQSATEQTSKKLGVATVALLAAAVTLLLLDRFIGPGETDTKVAGSAPVAGEESQAIMPSAENDDTAVERRSVAVLPFANRSLREEDQFFADGMHDDLLTQLAKIGSLKVISRTSVMEYRETTKKIPQIAAELGVATVLEGGVQRAGKRVRINVQLIDAGTDEHLWAENFDRELTAENVFEIQSEIAQKIADALQATLSPEEKAQMGRVLTHDLDALAAYSRARNLEQVVAAGDLERAQQEIDFALERDPRFAEAWALRARINTLRYWFIDPDPAYVDAAWEAIRTGRSIRPDLVDLDIAEGYYYYHGKLDYDAALALLEKAARSWPNNADLYQLMGWIRRRAGDFEGSIGNFNKSFELDPRNALTAVGLADVYMNVNRFDDAQVWVDTALRLGPTFAYARYMQATLLVGQGAFADARRVVETTEFTFSDLPYLNWWLPLVQGDYETALERIDFGQFAENRDRIYPPAMMRGLTLILRGDIDAGRRSLAQARAELESHDLATAGSPLFSALCLTYGGLGLAEETLSACRRAVEKEQFDAVANPNNRFAMAGGLALAGLHDDAFELLETVLKMRARPAHAVFEAEPTLRGLHDDPRFNALLDTYFAD